MRYLWLFLLISTASFAQVGSTASTCIWSGSLADCLPSTGINLRDNRVVRFGELASNGANYVAITAPTSLSADFTDTLPPATGIISLNPGTTTGDIFYCSTTATPCTEQRLGIGSSATVLHGGTTPSYSAVSLTADVTGVLPLANGGTNKNMTAAAGGIVWTDSDSMEVTGAGTGSDWVLSGGSATPTMSSTTTSAKTFSATTDASSSTTGTVIVSGGVGIAKKLYVGTSLNFSDYTQGIVGTATNDSAGAGFVGEAMSGSANSIFDQGTPVSGTYYDVPNVTVTLTAGDWDVWYGLSEELSITGASTSATAFSSIRTGSTVVQEISACIAYGSFGGVCYGNGSGYARVSLTGSTAYKVSIRAVTGSGSPSYQDLYARSDQTVSYIKARRVR